MFPANYKKIMSHFFLGSKTALTPKEDVNRRLSHPTVHEPQTPVTQVRRADSLPWSNSSQATNTNNYKTIVDALPTPPGYTSTQTRSAMLNNRTLCLYETLKQTYYETFV